MDGVNPVDPADPRRRRPLPAAAPARPAPRREETAYDRRWAGDARRAVYGSSGFLTLIVLSDWGVGTLTWWRAALWTLLAVMLLLVLMPPRLTAGEGWLTVRGLWGERGVRTDALVGVELSGTIAERVILRDAFGGRVEVDLPVIVDGPLLWHLLETGARRSVDRGWLPRENAALRELRERTDGTAAAAVFRISGLE